MNAAQVRRVLTVLEIPATEEDVDRITEHINLTHRSGDRDEFVAWARTKVADVAADLSARYGAEVYFDGRPLGSP